MPAPDATNTDEQPEIYQKLLSAIEANGTLTEKEFRRLSMLAFVSLFDIVSDVPQLRRKNILIWIEKHPKWTSVIVTGLILFAMFVHQISPWVIDHLAMLTGIKLIP